MDIVTAPYQPAPSPRSRLLIGAGVFAPVTLLTMLPVGLGLHRFVATTDEMAPAIHRGALVLERDVPVDALEVGDVITFVPPAASGIKGPVTRRIVTIEGSLLRTKADARPEADPWPVPIAAPTQDRVVLQVPWVGYAYVGLMHPSLWSAVTASLVAAALIVLAAWLHVLLERRRLAQEPRRPTADKP